MVKLAKASFSVRVVYLGDVSAPSLHFTGREALMVLFSPKGT